MSLQLLSTPARLITDVDPVIINLCKQFEVDAPWIDMEHDHMYLALADTPEIYLTSSSIHLMEDVYVSPDVFLNIILDIVSGMTTKFAYEKQGYTF